MSNDKTSPNKINWRAGIHDRLYVNNTIIITNPYIPTQSGSIDINNAGNIALAGSIDITGSVDISGLVAISKEQGSTPSQPSDGIGYLYTKSDGKLYWRSHDLGETDLTFGATGDISSVVAGTGLSGGGTSGDVTLNIDLSELTDMTQAVNSSQDELIILDNGEDRRKLISEIPLSAFNNDTSFTSNTGDMTGVDLAGGTGIDIGSETNTTSGNYSAIISVDVSDFMTNGTDNRIVTATGTDAMNAEANLTFDGTDLAIANQGKLIFDSTDTFIAASAANPEDLLLHADNNILLHPDTNIQISNGDNSKVNGNLGGLHIIDTADLGAQLFLNKYTAADTDIDLNDTLGMIGYGRTPGDGTNNADQYTAIIGAYASEDWSNSAHGTRIEFKTVKNGATGYSTHMTIGGDGNVGIGTTTPRHALDIPDVGGLILSMVALEHGSNQTYLVTTSWANIASTYQTPVITFVAPASGNVELQISAYLADITDNAKVLYMSIGVDSTYNSSNSLANQKTVWQTDESDDITINTSWVLTGLTAGTSYTYYIAAKSSGSNNHTFYWGNSRQPFIIRAVALPSSIVTDN